MAIVSIRREDPLANSRLIASAVLSRLDGPTSKAGPRQMALNALCRLASAMKAHGYYGMANPAYLVLSTVLETSASEATGLAGADRWTRIQSALRLVNDGRGSESDRKIVRTMAHSLERRLAAA